MNINLNQAFDDVVASSKGTSAFLISAISSVSELYDISEGSPERIYSSIEDLISDIASAYRDTILSFYRLGCKSVQYDDTALGLMCDDNYTKRLLQG